MLSSSSSSLLLLLLCVGVLALTTCGVEALPSIASASPKVRHSIATRKATCPFIGSLVNEGDLKLYGNAAQPLAKVDDVVDLGNTGGGHLGDVLYVFAHGNHAFTANTASEKKLHKPVPLGFFSLDFPASQGSHPGHSGILQGDPTIRNTGRFDEEAWKRLLAYEKKGHIKRSDFGRFIAHNLKRDPKSKLFSGRVLVKIIADVGRFLKTVYGAAKSHISHEGEQITEPKRKSLIALTKALGEQNLVGSSGEFGLLLAFLANSPRTKKIDGEPAFAVADLQIMFKQYRLPAGWKNWPKRMRDWFSHSTRLAYHATVELIKIRNN